MILFREMEPITKLLDKNLSQLRYEEPVTRGCFWPLSCCSAILGYSIHVTRAQFVVLSMAFFIFILYKPELVQIGTILVVIDVAIKFLLLLLILQNLWNERLENLLFLALIRCLLKFFFMIAMKILVTFTIFAIFADFSTPFLALFLSKSRIWLRLLFLLFLPYLLLSLFR